MRLVSIILFLALPVCTFAQALPDTPVKNKSSRQIKVDIISLYNTLFDVRHQVRLGIEYQGKPGKRLAHTYHLDFGLYDQYVYNKYFDFFGTDGGLYKEETKVKTFGLEALYGVKYILRKPEDKRIHYFACLLADLNLFHKKLRTQNSRTNETKNLRMNQFRIGIGPELGFEFKLYKRIHIEFKTAILFKTYTVKSLENSPNIKPYKALWYGMEHNYWIIPRLNLAYEI